MSSSDHLPDSVPDHWTKYLIPDWAFPYAQLARFERPIGWWLLLLPCWWSVALATPNGNTPNIWYLFLFFIGAVFMRGAGCTYNDIVDRKLDAHVARTANRPIPSGRVSAKAAAYFLFIQCLIGFIVLMQFDWFSVFLGFSSLGIVIIYPLMKRFFWAPQLILGMAFSWGALMGWSVVMHTIGPTALLLYGGTILWVIGYDTIYALQDLEDDILAGIHSSARLFGQYNRFWISVCYLGSILLITLSLYSKESGIYAYIGLVCFFCHLCWQILRLDPQNPILSLKLFRSNRNAGLIFFIFLSLDCLL